VSSNLAAPTKQQNQSFAVVTAEGMDPPYVRQTRLDRD
jgi:hypothetical protein